MNYQKTVNFSQVTINRLEVDYMDYAKESLRLHQEWKGKIQVVTNVPVETQEDLSLAYTPGVAQPCLESVV